MIHALIQFFLFVIQILAYLCLFVPPVLMKVYDLGIYRVQWNILFFLSSFYLIIRHFLVTRMKLRRLKRVRILTKDNARPYIHHQHVLTLFLLLVLFELYMTFWRNYYHLSILDYLTTSVGIVYLYYRFRYHRLFLTIEVKAGRFRRGKKGRIQPPWIDLSPIKMMIIDRPLI